MFLMMSAAGRKSLALKILRCLLIVVGVGGGWGGWGGGNWFKRAHVRRFLGLIQSEKLLVGLDKCEMLARKDIQPTVNQPCP